MKMMSMLKSLPKVEIIHLTYDRDFSVLAYKISAKLGDGT
jgi:hypothetical protein